MKMKYIALILLFAGCSTPNNPATSNTTPVPPPSSKNWMGTWYARDAYWGIIDTLIINDSTDPTVSMLNGHGDSLVTLNRANDTNKTTSGRFYVYPTFIDLIF